MSHEPQPPTTEEPKYYTGKTGDEHHRIAALGQDYLAVLTGPDRWRVKVKPETWEEVKASLARVEWNSFVIVRAMSLADARDAAPHAEDQYEAFINGDLCWLDIVLIPIAERTF
jgi:hypothetical protein